MKKQICKKCTYYTAYYRRLSDCYIRLGNGYCTKHKKPQTQYETCEDYKNNEFKEQSREERLFVSLEQSLTSINEIAMILKEKYLDS